MKRNTQSYIINLKRRSCEIRHVFDSTPEWYGANKIHSWIVQKKTSYVHKYKEMWLENEINDILIAYYLSNQSKIKILRILSWYNRYIRFYPNYICIDIGNILINTITEKQNVLNKNYEYYLFHEEMAQTIDQEGVTFNTLQNLETSRRVNRDVDKNVNVKAVDVDKKLINANTENNEEKEYIRQLEYWIRQIDIGIMINKAKEKKKRENTLKRSGIKTKYSQKLLYHIDKSFELIDKDSDDYTERRNKVNYPIGNPDEDGKGNNIEDDNRNGIDVNDATINGSKQPNNRHFQVEKVLKNIVKKVIFKEHEIVRSEDKKGTWIGNKTSKMWKNASSDFLINTKEKCRKWNEENNEKPPKFKPNLQFMICRDEKKRKNLNYKKEEQKIKNEFFKNALVFFNEVKEAFKWKELENSGKYLKKRKIESREKLSKCLSLPKWNINKIKNDIWTKAWKKKQFVIVSNNKNKNKNKNNKN